jgi:hypothetical protein
MIPKKKSRPISVDGVNYRWMIRGDKRSRWIHAAPVAATITVGLDSKKAGRPLQCAVVSRRIPENYDSECDYPKHQASITPQDITFIIHLAIQQGWDSEEKGSAFLLKSDRELGDYKLTSP